MKKKIISQILVFLMLLSIFPTAFAAEPMETQPLEMLSSAEMTKREERAEGSVYLDHIEGSDDNDGKTPETAVKTFEKAKELLPADGTIWLKNIYTVTGKETWSLEGKGNAMVKRYRYGKDVQGEPALICGNMIELDENADLTLENIIIDGAKDLWQEGEYHNNAIVAGPDGGKLTLNSGAVLQNNNATYMGAAVSGWSGFELTMNEGAAIRNNDSYGHEYGGGVFVAEGKFVMNGGTISGNSANRGGGVAIVAGEFEMNGGVIENNRTFLNIGQQPGYGGGVYLSSFEGFSGAPSVDIGGPVTFNMNGGEIRGNHAQSVGGGILTFPQQGNKITINMTGGKITENLTEDSGGGICMYFRDSALNMTGGEISGNTAQRYGGGIYQYQTQDATINGGSVIDNTADWSGGGVHLTNGARLMLYGGEISNNRAESNGGGVSIDKVSLFYMAGGAVQNNTSKFYGGGVYLPWSSSNKDCFCMIGGTVQGNRSEIQADSNGRIWRGDGVYVGARFELGRTAKIDPDNDVFLLSNWDRHIEVISPYTGTTGAEPIQITSNEADVEGEKIGTKLVQYSEKAGGAEAAKQADLDGIFVPSSYMADDLMIGQSAYENDWMTYIPGVAISYQWVGDVHPTDVQVPQTDRVRVNTAYTAREQTPTKEAYLFEGWFTDETCTSKFENGTEINQNTTLYGKWRKTSPLIPLEPSEPIVKPDPGPGPGPGPAPTPNPDHHSPANLNTRDHYSYIIGYPDGNVRPQGTITRAEVATIFFRLLTDEARDRYWCQTNGYTDVPADLWSNNAISTLSNMGIINGFEDGTFRPEDTVTRAQFAKIAVSFFQTTSQRYTGRFKDVATDAWYTAYVETAADIGLITGFEDGTFRPDAPITRAQACAIVNRTLGRRPHKDHLLPVTQMITWPDNTPDDWFYADMQEATNSHDYRMTAQWENWTEKLPQRDWASLERQWSDAHSSVGGEVTR